MSKVFISVAGWNNARWLDTGTFRGRWLAAVYAMSPMIAAASQVGHVAADAGKLVSGAVSFWGNPTLSSQTVRGLTRFASHALADATSFGARDHYAASILNGLRLLVAVSPDYQTC